MMLYRNMKTGGEAKSFDIVAGVLQGDTLALYLFILCQNNVLQTSIDPIKENGFTLKMIS